MEDKKEKIIKVPGEDLSTESAGHEEIENTVEEEHRQDQKELAEPEIAHEKMKLQIESMDLDDALKVQAHSHAQDLQSLETKQKIEKLLQAAKEKGVVFAVHVAKKMNDPYILDTFHDMLAKEGYYKEFVK